MSPTSYRTAPPRDGIVCNRIQPVKEYFTAKAHLNRQDAKHAKVFLFRTTHHTWTPPAREVTESKPRCQARQVRLAPIKLPFEGHFAKSQLDRHRCFVHALERAWAQMPVHFDRCPNDGARQLIRAAIRFHLGSLAA